MVDAISKTYRDHEIQESSDSISCLYTHYRTLDGYLQYKNQIFDSPKFRPALDSNDSSVETKSSLDLLLALKHNSSIDFLALVDQYLYEFYIYGKCNRQEDLTILPQTKNLALALLVLERYCPGP